MSIDFSKYRDMPVSPTPAEIVASFWELLSIPITLGSTQSLEIVEALDEVADRQWHTYTRLDPIIRNALDDWIAKNWDLASVRFTEHVTSIIGTIGLPRSAELARSSLHRDLLPLVKGEIESALLEFGSAVDDPYSGMK